MIHPRALRMFFVFIIVFLVFTIFCNALTGCSRKPAKTPSENQGSEKKESHALGELQTEVESVLKEYEKVYLAQTAPPPQSPEQSQGSNKQEQQQSESQDSGKGEKGGQGGSEQQQSSEGEQGGQSDKKADWPKMEQDIAKIHEQWNSFQSEAIKSGASHEMIDDFSNTLNHLTMTITRQELYEGLITVTNLYGKTIDFEKLFKTNSPPDIKKILYHKRLATYKILNNDEAGAKESIHNALTAWDTIKPQVNDATKSSNAEFSLKELDQAITEKDPNLIKIKAQISENNIRDVIESMGK